MSYSFSRTATGLILGLSISTLPLAAGAADNVAPTPAPDANPQVAEVDQLESQAFAAIRDGHFDKTSELLSEAATMDQQDATVQKMAGWARQFDTEEQKFDKQRDQEFQKNVADIHKLLDHGMPDYAVGAAAAAYLRAPNQDEFRHEKWINDLVNKVAADAQTATDNQQWFPAEEMYADLSGLDPYKPEWKDDLNKVMRHMELLALYTPDLFRSMRDAYDKASQPAAKLLGGPSDATPTTQPDDDNDSFKFDWHDSVRGVTNDMLADALIYAQHDYFRPAPYQKLLDGGIDGMQMMADTRGLEKTFPGLGDATKRAAFVKDLQDARTQVSQLSGDDQEGQVRQILDQLEEDNVDTVSLPDEVFVTEFTNAALAQLDPFTSMIWPDDLEEFNKATEGQFSGIGVQIQSDGQGNLCVVTPLEDSPAYKAGIGAGDIITRINGKNAKGITLLQAVHTITGPPDTSVHLTVQSPDGAVKEYDIIRQQINVASIKGYERQPGGSWDYFVDPQNKIAYIRLTNFTKNSGEELISALQQLKDQGARGLIFDLRDNPGGLLTSAVEVASQFIRTGTIVSTHPDRETENRPMVDTAMPDDTTTDMPLVVLVNQYSASASEIVSGALKDDHRATIIGERTFGKGSVQMLFPLADRTAYLKLTTAHYYLPSGRCLHREENSTDWGVDPDIKIPLTPEQTRDVIEARQKMDVLREGNNPTTKPVPNDMLSTDPQLSAALLVLRLKLAGAQL